MAVEQLVIPGMPPPSPPKPKKINVQEQITQFQGRVLQLELEATLLRLQLEKGAGE